MNPRIARRGRWKTLILTIPGFNGKNNTGKRQGSRGKSDIYISNIKVISFLILFKSQARR